MNITREQNGEISEKYIIIIKARVYDQQIQTTIHEIDKQQDLLYSTKIQYLVINFNRKKCENIYIYN